MSKEKGRVLKFEMWNTVKQKEWTLPYYATDLKYPKHLREHDDVVVRQYIGMNDKNGEELYEGNTVKYTKTTYTDCSRKEVQEEQEPVIGRLYYAEGMWLGLLLEDGSVSIFMPGNIHSDEFELLSKLSK